jgi:hypothetical protein
MLQTELLAQRGLALTHRCRPAPDADAQNLLLRQSGRLSQGVALSLTLTPRTYCFGNQAGTAQEPSLHLPLTPRTYCFGNQVGSAKTSHSSWRWRPEPIASAIRQAQHRSRPKPCRQDAIRWAAYYLAPVGKMRWDTSGVLSSATTCVGEMRCAATYDEIRCDALRDMTARWWHALRYLMSGSYVIKIRCDALTTTFLICDQDAMRSAFLLCEQDELRCATCFLRLSGEMRFDEMRWWCT